MGRFLLGTCLHLFTATNTEGESASCPPPAAGSPQLQESRLTPSPGAVNMPSGPVSGVIGGKTDPAYSFTPCFLCPSTHAFGKDNATFVVTSLVSKQMPLWEQLLLYTSKTCVCISDIYSRSANNSSFPFPVPPPAGIAFWGSFVSGVSHLMCLPTLNSPFFLYWCWFPVVVLGVSIRNIAEKSSWSNPAVIIMFQDSFLL